MDRLNIDNSGKLSGDADILSEVEVKVLVQKDGNIIIAVNRWGEDTDGEIANILIVIYWTRREPRLSQRLLKFRVL